MRALAALSVLSAAVVGLAAGCGDGHSVVGGTCAAGYVQCGARCVLGECGGASDAEAFDATDTGTDGPSGQSDGAAADGALSNDSGGDVKSPTDGPAPEGAASDGSLIDGTSNDAPASDAITSDTLGVDSASNDATVDGGAASDAQPSEGAPSEATPSDGASDDGSDGATDDVTEEPLCTAPLVDCSGVCIDTTMDPANCGACGTTCYSGICQSSHCVGETTGSLIFIGHDYTTYSQAQARLLANAVLLPQAAQMVPVLSYERYAGATPLANVKNIVATAAMNIGRTLVMTSTKVDDDVTNGLTIDKYGVFLVADQPGANPGDLGALGSTWMTVVSAFARAGGVVVVLDSDTGVQEMPAFVTSTQLLTVTAQTSVPIFTQVNVAVPTDAIAQGVASPYAVGAFSASFVTEPAGGNVVYVVTDPGLDGSPASPLVIHKVF